MQTRLHYERLCVRDVSFCHYPPTASAFVVNQGNTNQDNTLNITWSSSLITVSIAFCLFVCKWKEKIIHLRISEVWEGIRHGCRIEHPPHTHSLSDEPWVMPPAEMEGSVQVFKSLCCQQEKHKLFLNPCINFIWLIEQPCEARPSGLESSQMLRGFCFFIL